MTLLTVLCTDISTIIMGFLQSHDELLQVASPIRSSKAFAWEAATQQDFNLRKVSERLRSEALARRALEYGWGNFDRLWSSIPFATVDLMAFACVHRGGDAYNHVPEDTRSNVEFVKGLVRHAAGYDPDRDYESVPEFWLPRAILSNDRDLALECARKAIWLFGPDNDLYVGDQEVVETFLKTQAWCHREFIENVCLSPWCTREWILRMCSDAPETASTFIDLAQTPQMQLEIIAAVPTESVHGVVADCSRSSGARVWRAAVRRNPKVIGLVGSWCEIRPSDEPLLTSIFRSNP